MKKVLIAFFSHSGKTEQMAEYVAEGVRIKGLEATVKDISEVKTAADIEGYDGYIFGSPTFSLDMPAPMRTFLALPDKIDLKGKLAGSFGSYSHEVSYQPGAVAATLILETMERELKMEPFSLGPLRLKEDLVETREGMRACQDYGKAFGEKLGT